MRRIAVAFFLLSCFAALRAGAADGPLHFRPGEKVKAIFGSTGDVRIVGVGLVAGTKLSVTARAVGQSRALPGIDLLDPTGAPVALGGADRSKPGYARVKGFAIPTTGLWRIKVGTQSGAGGEIEVTVKGKTPSRFSRKVVAGAEPLDVPFDALAGTILKSMTVRCAARPAWTPQVEVIAPSGAVVTTAAGRGAAATLRNILLEELGTYRVRVSGGEGAFRVQATLVPPKPRKDLTWKDVETPPTATSFTPLAVPNDTLTTFKVNGAGLLTGQVVQFRLDGVTRVSAAITGSVVQTELADAPEGAYELHVTTPLGNSVRVPGTLSVTNRTPVLGSMYPDAGGWLSAMPVMLRGAGIDPGATVTVTTSGTQTPVSIEAVRRDHRQVDLTLHPAPYFTGPCDVTITDPGRAPVTTAAAFDVLGWRAAPQNFVSYAASDAYSHYLPLGTAYDDAGARVAIAVQEGVGDVRFVLVDAVSLAVLDNVKIVRPSPSVGLLDPKVAFDPTTRLWALLWIERRATYDSARIRIVGSDDLDDVRGDAYLGTATAILEVHAAPDPDRGGFVAVWDAGTLNFGDPSAINVNRVGPTGALGTPREVAYDSEGWTYHASITRAGAGKYVVVYSGIDPVNFEPALRRVVVDGDGFITHADLKVVSSPSWLTTAFAFTATHPSGESVLIGFSYFEDTAAATWRPSTIVLLGDDLTPGGLISVDDDGGIPSGYVMSTVWNATREEFVLTAYVAGVNGTRTLVRRVAPDGRIRGSPIPHEMEGYGLLWSGAAADTLGLARAFDGTDDGNHRDLFTMYINGGKLR